MNEELNFTPNEKQITMIVYDALKEYQKNKENLIRTHTGRLQFAQTKEDKPNIEFYKNTIARAQRKLYIANCIIEVIERGEV